MEYYKTTNRQKKRWVGQMENKNNLMKNQHIFLQVDSS